MEGYVPKDPTLQQYHNGLAELREGDQVRAYLGCRVGRLGLRGDGAPWPWFVVGWPDGRNEPAEEDYGPDWLIVRDLDEGRFVGRAEPSIGRPLRWGRLSLGTWRVTDDEEVSYDVHWLPPEEAARKADELGLTDRDF